MTTADVRRFDDSTNFGGVSAIVCRSVGVNSLHNAFEGKGYFYNLLTVNHTLDEQVFNNFRTDKTVNGIFHTDINRRNTRQHGTRKTQHAVKHIRAYQITLGCIT